MPRVKLPGFRSRRHASHGNGGRRRTALLAVAALLASLRSTFIALYSVDATQTIKAADGTTTVVHLVRLHRRQPLGGPRPVRKGPSAV
jgi:type II secretory pathway component PulL